MAASGLPVVSASWGRIVAVPNSTGSLSSRIGRASMGLDGGGGGRARQTGAAKLPLAALVSLHCTDTRVRSGRRNGFAKASARQGVDSAKEDVGLLYPTTTSKHSAREFEMFQQRRWGDAPRDESRQSARELFATRGEITEVDMDRLVDALLQEEGQSAEEHQQRAIFFDLIAEFLRHGVAYSTETDESWTSMQMLFDSILAEDGRSPTDYNARAEFFAKSAEVFPFNAGVEQT